MLRFRNIIFSLVFISVVAFCIPSCGAEEIEDQIDIIASEGKIIAVVEGKRKVSVHLGTHETVLWSASEGFLGAVLTDKRFLAITTYPKTWQYFTLRIGESEEAVASISPYLALLVTGNRAIGFDAASSRFIETQIPIRDEIIAAEVEKYVAVVVTSSRAYGLALKTTSFVEFFLRSHETIHSINVTASKAVIQSSDRLLTFEAEAATWKELRL